MQNVEQALRAQPSYAATARRARGCQVQGIGNKFSDAGSRGKWELLYSLAAALGVRLHWLQLRDFPEVIDLLHRVLATTTPRECAHPQAQREDRRPLPLTRSSATRRLCPVHARLCLVHAAAAPYTQLCYTPPLPRTRAPLHARPRTRAAPRNPSRIRSWRPPPPLPRISTCKTPLRRQEQLTVDRNAATQHTARKAERSHPVEAVREGVDGLRVGFCVVRLEGQRSLPTRMHAEKCRFVGWLHEGDGGVPLPPSKRLVEARG